MGAARKRRPPAALARAADVELGIVDAAHHLGKQRQVETEFAWVQVELLKVWVKNPRRNERAVSKVAASIRRWGFVRPIVVNLWKGCLHEIIVGHTARLAAIALGLTHVPVRFIEMEPTEAHAAALADNKLGEISEWDKVQLGEIVAGELVARPLLEIAGFNTAEIDTLGRPLVANDDEVPERPKRPVTKPGDIWQLGPHRLICGDSRIAEVVAALLAGALPRLLVTDPPYGVKFDPTWRRQVALRTGICKPPKRTGKVQNDDNASWLDAWKLSPAWVAYVWHGALHSDVVKQDLQQALFEIRSQIIWAKPQINFTRATYHWQHEPCWYGVRKGKQAHWLADRKQSTLWQIESKHGLSNPDGDDTEHSTQKPVECHARPIRHHAGDVHDPFVGSGTGLIAADQLGRRCYAADIDPAWCDVTIERWQKQSGGKAERVTGARAAPSRRPRKAA